ncbi:MAG: LysR family transcriptional regulator [Lachnospiraceae bacterium]|nr:LysR family transcriptional regulator [Lachnospiraceae bacterium]
MNNSPLYYVLTIEEERSISKAAKKLGISQPALSSYINKLEKKLGGRVFDRSVLPIELTELGRVYLDYVRKSYALEAEFDRQYDDLKDFETGSLIIGGAHSFTAGFFPVPTARFHGLHPGIDIKIIDARVPELKEMAEGGEIDCFIAADGDQGENMASEVFLNERILISVPAGLKINDGLKQYAIPREDIFDGSVTQKEYKNVPLEALKDLTFVVLEEDQDMRRIFDRLYEKHGLKPSAKLVVGQTTTSFSLTIYGVGASLVSDKTVRYGNYRDLPVFYAFDAELARRKLVIAYSKERYVSLACREYIKTVIESFK